MYLLQLHFLNSKKVSKKDLSYFNIILIILFKHFLLFNYILMLIYKCLIIKVECSDFN
jgi:hypothetical protein